MSRNVKNLIGEIFLKVIFYSLPLQSVTFCDGITVIEKIYGEILKR